MNVTFLQRKKLISLRFTVHPYLPQISPPRRHWRLVTIYLLPAAFKKVRVLFFFFAVFTGTDLVNSGIEELKAKFRGMCNNIPALCTATDPCQPFNFKIFFIDFIAQITVIISLFIL